MSVIWEGASSIIMGALVAIPLWGVKVIVIAMFVGLALWALSMPAQYIYKGAPDQSRWRDVRIVAAGDSGQDLRVSVVNTRENSDYESPPGVDEVVDRVTLIGQGEQSLLLNFTRLQPRIPDGDTLFVIDSTIDTTGTIIVDTTIELRDRIDRAIVSQTLLSSLDFTGYRLSVLQKERPPHSHQAGRHRILGRVLGQHMEPEGQRKLTAGHGGSHARGVGQSQIGVGTDPRDVDSRQTHVCDTVDLEVYGAERGDLLEGRAASKNDGEHYGCHVWYSHAVEHTELAAFRAVPLPQRGHPIPPVAQRRDLFVRIPVYHQSAVRDHYINWIEGGKPCSVAENGLGPPWAPVPHSCSTRACSRRCSRGN